MAGSKFEDLPAMFGDGVSVLFRMDFNPHALRQSEHLRRLLKGSWITRIDNNPLQEFAVLSDVADRFLVSSESFGSQSGQQRPERRDNGQLRMSQSSTLCNDGCVASHKLVFQPEKLISMILAIVAVDVDSLNH